MPERSAQQPLSAHNASDFRWGLRFTVPTLDTPVLVGRKRDRLRIAVGDELEASFDTDGRPVRLVVDGREYRRLATRLLDMWPGPCARPNQPSRRELTDRLFATVLWLHQTLVDGRPANVETFGKLDDASHAAAGWLERAARYHPEQPEKTHAEFASVYRTPCLLPPDQHMAVVLQATEGVSSPAAQLGLRFDRATGRVRTLTEFLEHMDDVTRLLGPEMHQKRSVFLAGDAIGVRQALLVRMLDAINAALDIRLPMTDRDGREFYPPHEPGRYHGIYAFAHSFHGQRKRAGDFRELARRNLRRLYLGVDSGHDELLSLGGRQTSAGDVLHTAAAAKNGGLRLGVIVTLGLGGESFASEHVRRTALLLNTMRLGPEDTILFRPVAQSPPFAGASRDADRLSPEALLAQRAAMRKALDVPSGVSGPSMATYTFDKLLY